MNQIKKVLIANRGEIAIRIMKTLSVMDIASVAIYAHDDKRSLFVKEADEAFLLEGTHLSDTYLNHVQIIQIAKESNCDAIHPGYGFLSENSSFAKGCKEAGIIFIGPPEEAIDLMGDKVVSREFAEQHGIPLLKGITGNQKELLEKKGELIYPVIIKPSAGGGGKGMRVVYKPENLESALISTAREAESYFGNGEVFIERFIEKPRHIEVQVIGDQHGNLIHLYERECTIQRRHQKVIEEAPSITLTDEQRESVTSTALSLAKAANYYSAGTVEFIVDEDLKFYFMEMNTRVQVEHPVTELITDFDIVEQQIKIAEGQPLPFQQKDIQIDGHAIECRIYAEDPSEDFRPSPGEIRYYSQPETEFTRIDTALNQPQVISDRYDPMISKVITWGENRSAAIQHMKEALNEFVIEGVPTNILFLKSILSDTKFRENDISTNYCKEFTGDLLDSFAKEKEEQEIIIPLIAFLHQDFPSGFNGGSVWNNIGLFRNEITIPLLVDEKEILLTDFESKNNQIKFNLDGQSYRSTLLDQDEKGVEFSLNEQVHYSDVHQLSSNRKVVVFNGFDFSIQRQDVLDDQMDFELASAQKGNQDAVFSPIPGTVIDVLVKEGEEVKEGQSLIIVEAMKMENSLVSPRDGIIEKVNSAKGEKVQAGKELIQLVKGN